MMHEWGLQYEAGEEAILADNLTTVFLTWQIISVMSETNELRGGHFFSGNFGTMARALQDLTSLE